jgi:hypothetical protein
MSIQQLCLLMTFSVEDFPASRSLWLEEEKLKQMKGGSGPKSCESFAYLDRATSCWKTFQVCLAPEWETYSETWPMAGMTRNGIAYRRQPLVPRTSDTGSLLWATPLAADAIGSQGGGQGRSLRTDIRNWKANLWPTPRPCSGKGSSGANRTEFYRRMWATPTASDGTKPRGPNSKQKCLAQEARMWPTPRAGKTSGEDPEKWAKRQRAGKVTTPPLEMAVKMWPTPTSRDHKDGTAESCKNVPVNGLLGRAVHRWPTPTQADGMGGPGSSGRDGGQNLRTSIGGQLNPMWIEWLMGFPLGWTACDVSATPSSRRSSNGLDCDSKKSKRKSHGTLRGQHGGR